MSALFRVFPNDPVPSFVDYADGMYIHTMSGEKLLDMTAGSTSFAILGWNHPKINKAIQKQLKRFTHMDYKVWSDKNTEEIATLLLSRAEHGLNRIYFSGNSGAEACEAAMKMSYQVHCDSGNPQKTWFISREQSYHGATTDALALGERPNLAFYHPLLPKNRAKISQHHPKHMMRADETLDEYAKRAAQELENKILEIGPDKVAAFVAETMMGGLVGDVPPAPKYWQYVREVCDKYHVHLILDEVYCGTGSSGKIYCCDWDGVKPDFIFMGKTIAAGYAPISVVVTSDKVENIIKNGQGRLQHTTTHQAYSLGIAAALEVQKIIHTDEMLGHINKIGEYLKKTLRDELSQHPFFYDVRGRGLRLSIEYQCDRREDFSLALAQQMKEKYNVFVSGKWHRISFTPAFIINSQQADYVLEGFIEVFKKTAANWT
ncbi:MAG TPA: aminotransferase class III-fold pyridoxal phosphate-dependent enzyme [Gammaproteobacteria bacterium]|nr:aminotransferase class III-fold pyridoxal phosphate-dependent enzyme [Gammaproteobacteria bacterium]